MRPRGLWGLQTICCEFWTGWRKTHNCTGPNAHGAELLQLGVERLQSLRRERPVALGKVHRDKADASAADEVPVKAGVAGVSDIVGYEYSLWPSEEDGLALVHERVEQLVEHCCQLSP